MGTPEVVAAADQIMQTASDLRTQIVRRGKIAAKARLLTGLWLAWTWAERARARALDPTKSLGQAGWMLGYAADLLYLLLSGPPTEADSLMGLIQIGGHISLVDPATRAAYAGWVLEGYQGTSLPLPVPYQPRPGLRPAWPLILYYRYLGRYSAVRLLHRIIRLGL
jgi:hypothetical protein